MMVMVKVSEKVKTEEAVKKPHKPKGESNLPSIAVAILLVLLVSGAFLIFQLFVEKVLGPEYVGVWARASLNLLFLGCAGGGIGYLYQAQRRQQSFLLKQARRVLQKRTHELKKLNNRKEELKDTLEKSEGQNRAIIDSVTDIIFETDTEGKILFLNSTWRKVTGFSSNQSLGHDLFSMLHPSDQETQRSDFKFLVDGEKDRYRTFTRLRTSDGTFRAVELAMSMIRLDENKKLRVVGTFTDVEQRRRAERALSEAEKKYRTIVDNAASGIYQLTPEGLYLACNPAMARILGYDSPEDVVMINANQAVYTDLRERADFRRDLERNGSISNYETQVYKANGDTIWINENSRLVKDENGNILYYEGSVEDITQRKEAELALHGAKVTSDIANRAKSEFLANMSHELRTPLNAIIGFSEIIKNEVLGPVENKSYWEYARDIHDSGQGLLKVINDILDISKIEAGDRQLNESEVDLSKVIEAALDMLAVKIEDNKMSVHNTVSDVPLLIIEELAVKQVVLNLLSNAVKFTPSGGQITISSAMDQDGSIRFSFTDTGIGLSENDMKKALSAFGQLDDNLSKSGSGTGLGLTLAQSLMKLHGGRLEMFSEPGVGTTVSIIFPSDVVVVKPQEPEKKCVDFIMVDSEETDDA